MDAAVDTFERERDGTAPVRSAQSAFERHAASRSRRLLQRWPLNWHAVAIILPHACVISLFTDRCWCRSTHDGSVVSLVGAKICLPFAHSTARDWRSYGPVGRRWLEWRAGGASVRVACPRTAVAVLLSCSDGVRAAVVDKQNTWARARPIRLMDAG